ncbi:MAG TPA: hypothetical protein VK559_05765 [Ferruginibacter sp.]|nr:hypothetical protein [Ferruginibacter sp.]
MALKKMVPLFIVFVVFSILLLLSQSLFPKFGLDSNVLLIANTLFFILGVITFLIQYKALQNSNPNVFIRSVMSGMMLKMFVCVIAVLIYVLANRNNYSKDSIFAGAILYFVYLTVEVKVMLKLNNQKNA